MITVLRDVRPYGEDAVDITWSEGVITGISTTGASAPPQGARVLDGIVP